MQMHKPPPLPLNKQNQFTMCMDGFWALYYFSLICMSMYSLQSHYLDYGSYQSALCMGRDSSKHILVNIVSAIPGFGLFPMNFRMLLSIFDAKYS